MMQRTVGLVVVVVLSGTMLVWWPGLPAPAVWSQARTETSAETWAHAFDAHSLVVLRKASVRFDAERDFAQMRAKVLYVLSRTDKLFPPAIAPAVLEKLRTAGVEAIYVEIDSDFRHLASGREAEKWAPALQAFLERLTPAKP